MGRRTKASNDAALVLAAIVAVAAAAYFVLKGVVRLIAWVASRPKTNQVAASTPSHRFTLAPEPPPYRALIDVDPTVWHQPGEASRVATAVFGAWAGQIAKVPRRPVELVQRVTIHHRLVGRLTTALEGRRFVGRAAPYRGRDPIGSVAPLDPAQLDPYAPPHDLRERSRYLVVCAACGGDGRSVCAACGGASRVTCAACDGAGKAYGFAKNGSRRLLNCTSCRGKGAVACGGCARGSVECAACGTTGRIEHWLELEGGTRDGDVQVEPDEAITRAFAWGRDGSRASHDEIAADARVVTAVTMPGPIGLRDLPGDVPPAWIDAHWTQIQARLQPGERVTAQTFTLLDVPVVEVSYGVGVDQQSIELQGRRMLAPPVADDWVLTKRAAFLRRLAVGLGLAPIAALITYAARGDYFLTAMTAWLVIAVAAVAGLLYQASWHGSIGRPRGPWLLATLAPAAVAVTLAVFIEPSVDDARRYLGAGDLERARAELAALGRADDPERAALWDDYYRRLGVAASDSATARAYAEKVASPEARRDAELHADGLALDEARAHVAGGRLDDAERVLAERSPAVDGDVASRAVRGEIAVGRARRCLASKEWECVFRRIGEAESFGQIGATELRAAARSALSDEAAQLADAAARDDDVRRRIAAAEAAISAWSRYASETGTAAPARAVAVERRLAKDRVQLAKLVVAEQKAAERARKLAEREQQRRDKAERARAARELRETQRIERRERSCCKVCSRGCPCGDTCISCAKTCRVGPGCAC